MISSSYYASFFKDYNFWYQHPMTLDQEQEHNIKYAEVNGGVNNVFKRIKNSSEIIIYVGLE